jgi:hypothetical protein
MACSEFRKYRDSPGVPLETFCGDEIIILSNPILRLLAKGSILMGRGEVPMKGILL